MLDKALCVQKASYALILHACSGVQECALACFAQPACLLGISSISNLENRIMFKGTKLSSKEIPQNLGRLPPKKGECRPLALPRPRPNFGYSSSS